MANSRPQLGYAPEEIRRPQHWAEVWETYVPPNIRDQPVDRGGQDLPPSGQLLASLSINDASRNSRDSGPSPSGHSTTNVSATAAARLREMSKGAIRVTYDRGMLRRLRVKLSDAVRPELRNRLFDQHFNSNDAERLLERLNVARRAAAYAAEDEMFGYELDQCALHRMGLLREVNLLLASAMFSHPVDSSYGFAASINKPGSIDYVNLRGTGAPTAQRHSRAAERERSGRVKRGAGLEIKRKRANPHERYVKWTSAIRPDDIDDDEQPRTVELRLVADRPGARFEAFRDGQDLRWSQEDIKPLLQASAGRLSHPIVWY